MSLEDLDDRTRRAILKGTAGALGLAAVGTATGHPTESGGEDSHDTAKNNHSIHEHQATKNADLVGFHTLGGVGSESVSGGPDNPLYGMVTDVWLEGDLGFVAIQSSSAPTGNRGVAILDVSAYTRAESRAELDRAEMTVLSYIGNETEAGTGNDVKVSDDGQYLAYSKQAIGWDYGRTASASTEDQAEPGPNVTGAEVYDISDPGDPEYIGSAQGPNIGFHNCFVHQIGGDHYVFGIQGAVPGDAGVHIYRITDAGVVPVNFWGGGDLPVTGYGTDTTFYCHDFYAHEDPKTGRPVGYIAYWNNGVQVIDLSDPTDLELLGFGEMNVGHYAQPAPALIDGKRLFIGGQEHGSRSSGESGRVVLFDGDGLLEDGEVTNCERLDVWTLYDDVTYSNYAFSPHNSDVTEDGWITQSNNHAGVRFLKIQPPGEGDVATGEWHLAGKRVDRERLEEGSETATGETQEFSGNSNPDAFGNADNEAEHAFTTPDFAFDDPVLLNTSLEWSPSRAELDLFVQQRVDGEWVTVAEQQSPDGFKEVTLTVDQNAEYRYLVETDYGTARYTVTGEYIRVEDVPENFEPVREEAQAYYRSHVDVPDESMTDSEMSPNFWSARTLNGVTFAGGRNSGVYAIAADPMDVGTRTAADVSVTRNSDGTVFTGGQTNRLEYEVETDETVRLRDRLPSSWRVVGGDAHTAYDTGDGRRVEFDEPVDPTGAGTETRTLFVTVSGNDAPQVGPVEFSPDSDASLGGKDWETLPGTVESSLVGPSQP